MYGVDKLATHLVAEVPVPRLQLLLRRNPDEEPAFDGLLCGGNCSGRDGAWCGNACRPQSATDVIDRDGQLGLTAKDLADVRKDLPALRRAVTQEVDLQLARLK